MKNFKLLLLLSLVLFLGEVTISQNVTLKSPGADPYMIHQADSVKQQLIKEGFVIVKEASITMESENEMPVIVPLTEGSRYQFVFIGDITSKSYEVRMFDWEEKQVAYQKKQWDDADGNVISYSYVPKLTEYHMIKPVQVNNSKKDLNGYVMLLKKIKQ